MAWFQRKNADIRDTDHPAVVDADVPTDLSIQRVYDDRMQCYHHLNQVLSSVQKQSKGVVLKLYIENFKQLNDVFGYSYSENLLTQIISYLKEKTKTAVYQYIGMEFIVILEGYTQGQAISLADEILAQFDSVWRVDDTDCLCSVQIGMCSYNDAKLSVDDLLKYLDLAISKAGEGGPNQAMMYNSSLHDQFLRRQTIARYLKTAIDNHEIEVRYRPTYHIEKQRFTRAEFYMRIFIKGIGLIGKSEFIPIAEDSGQIRSLEYFALEQVGSCIAELITAGKEFDSISLPISSVLLLQEDFLDKIRELIDKYQIPQGKLALEINESALTMAYLNINIVMQDLSDLGIEIILNDFGTGYTSITSMLALPVNTLKLERLFIWQLETNENSAYIIDGLIQIAKHLHLNIIAEGCETEHQVVSLTNSGCNYQQGFYYSPTVAKETLMDVIDASLAETRQTLAAEKEKMKK